MNHTKSVSTPHHLTQRMDDRRAPLRPIVVVVDEDAQSLYVLQRALKDEPYEVYAFSSPQDALDTVRRKRVDIVVAEQSMRSMDGLTLLEHVRDVCPDATRIVLSGLEDRQPIFDALAEGIAHHDIMKPWDEGEVRALLAQTLRLSGEAQIQRLKDFLRSLNNLPSPPRFQQRMHEILENPNSSLNDLVREIEHSPAFVAKVLQVANSVYFGSRHRIATVHDAVLFVGMEYIGRLLMSIEVFQSFLNEVDVSVRFRVDQLWEEALRRAPLARTLVTRWKGSVFDPHTVYIASLLQDVGLLVRLCSEPERYETMIELWKTEGISLDEAERRTFGIPHAQVGGTLLQIWNFPDEIATAVALHHSYAAVDSLTQILQVADALTTGDPLLVRDRSLDATIEKWRVLLNLGPQGLQANNSADEQ